MAASADDPSTADLHPRRTGEEGSGPGRFPPASALHSQPSADKHSLSLWPRQTEHLSRPALPRLTTTTEHFGRPALLRLATATGTLQPTSTASTSLRTRQPDTSADLRCLGLRTWATGHLGRQAQPRLATATGHFGRQAQPRLATATGHLGRQALPRPLDMGNRTPRPTSAASTSNGNRNTSADLRCLDQPRQPDTSADLRCLGWPRQTEHFGRPALPQLATEHKTTTEKTKPNDKP